MSPLEQLARALLGVGAEQAKAELASGEISDTSAGKAFAIVLAQQKVIDAARRHIEDEAADAVAVTALETAENVTVAQQHQRGTRQRANESFGALCAALAAVTG